MLRTLLLAVVVTLSPVLAWANIAEEAYNATGMLYSQTRSGGMQMRCTVTAFEKTDTGYLFASASHCLSEDKDNEVKVNPGPFYISFDKAVNKVFHPAKVVMAGYQTRGDDFAILAVDTKEKWQTVPLGTTGDVAMGEEIVNIAAPKGLGRQLFFGRVSLLNLDRPVRSRGINWTNAMLLQIPSGPGSSGSSVISLEQEAIICFIVGGITGNPSTVAVSVAKFKAFRKAVEDGEYEWFTLEDEE